MYIASHYILNNERRKETHRIDRRRELPFIVICENRTTSQLVKNWLYLCGWLKKKIILFQCRADIRDGPARQWRSLTAYFSNVVRDTILKLLHNIVTCLIKFLMRFHHKFRSYSFFCKDGFLPFLHTFLRITQEPLNLFKIWLSHMKERLKTYQHHYMFYFINKFYKE